MAAEPQFAPTGIIPDNGPFAWIEAGAPRGSRLGILPERAHELQEASR
jgi:hypothetical protein